MTQELLRLLPTTKHSRVAARGLDEGIAGLDSAVSFGIFDHPPADPILDAPPRVEPLALGQHFHAAGRQPRHLLGDGVELDERSVADGREDVGTDGIAGGDEGRQWSCGIGGTCTGGDGFVILLGALGGIVVDGNTTGRLMRIFGAWWW